MKPVKWYLQAIRHPGKGIWTLVERFCERNIKNDKIYLSIKFFLLMGYGICWKKPKTFSEKLQWLKLYDYHPSYAIMADKVQAKDYVAKRIGSQYIIPTLGVWDCPDDVDFLELPDRFVIKCNHNSGKGMFICKDKSTIDEATVRNGLSEGLKEDYYAPSREKQYRDIPRRIIAEQFLEDEYSEDIPDFKVLCFNNGRKVILVCRNRFAETGLTEDFYDENWNHLDIQRPKHPNSQTPIARPLQLEEMLSLADKLSNGLPFLRVDFYSVNGRLFFGELTFFPAGGIAPFDPISVDREWGKWITLPGKRSSLFASDIPCS